MEMPGFADHLTFAEFHFVPLSLIKESFLLVYLPLNASHLLEESCL